MTHSPENRAPSVSEWVPSIEERTTGMQKLDGFFPIYWEERTGNLWLEISRFDSDFLYTTGLAAGLGSNDIGLDRGQQGNGRLVSFQRIGPKVLLVQPNESFRSSSPNPAERRSVEDSFAKSILWGFTVGGGEQRARAGGRHRFLPPRRPRRRNALRPGPYRVDRTRSAVLHAAHQSVPEEHRDRSDADLHQRGGRAGAAADLADRRKDLLPSAPGSRRGTRRRWTRRRPVLRLRRERHADRRSGDAARALLAGRTARRQLQAALRRSARRLRRPDLRRLQRADRRADADALHPPSSPGEERSERGDERSRSSRFSTGWIRARRKT